MSYLDHWQEQLKPSLIEAARLVQFAPDTDLKFELMVTGILYPVRRPVQDFDIEAMQAVQEVVGDQAPQIFQLLQSWGDDQLVAARELAAMSRGADLESALKTVIKYFQAFPVFALQLAGQVQAAKTDPNRVLTPANGGSATHPRVLISYMPQDGYMLADIIWKRLVAARIAVYEDLMPDRDQRDWWHRLSSAIAQVEYLILIMTPAAVEAETVRRQWRIARQHGTCIFPVTRADDIDYARLPRWIRQTHFYNFQIEADKLVTSLEGVCQTPRVPFMADDLPDDYVARTVALNQVIRLLFDAEREEAIAGTVALVGAGGYGKSMLAAAVCHDDDIRQVFDDGILWVTLGETPQDISHYVIDLIETLSGERPGFTTLDAAVIRFGELLADRNLLFVIDDVWNAAHLKPFLQGGKNCARLITTRNSTTLPFGTHIIEVGSMSPADAQRLLSYQLPSGRVNEINHLANRLDGWPLLIKLTNGVLRDRVELQQQGLQAAIDHVNGALDKYGLVAFDESEDGAVVGHTIEMSLELLNQDEQARLGELGIFPEDVDIPLATVEKLWGITGALDDFDTEELCDRLHSLSLLAKFDLTSRQVRLHNVMRRYLIYQQTGALVEYHAALLTAYRDRVNNWAEMPPDFQYMWSYLIYHLQRAELWPELIETVKDLYYLASKVLVKGVSYAESDVKLASALAPDDKVLDSLQCTISQASHLLAQADHITDVVSTLHSRLPVSFPLVVNRRYGPVLTARHPLPDLPHPFLVRTLSGHTSGVLDCALGDDGTILVSVDKDNVVTAWNVRTGESFFKIECDTEIWACALSGDGRMALFARADGYLTLWDVENEREQNTWQAHPDAVMDCAISRDSGTILSAAKDKTLKIWDIAGNKLHTLSGHQRTVTSCDISADGRIIVSASNDGSVIVWDGATGQQKHTFVVREPETGIDRLTFLGQRDVDLACALSADASTVAVVSSSAGMLTIWDMDSYNERLSRLIGNQGASACALSSDGSRIAVALNDTQVKVWDTHTNSPLWVLTGHSRSVNSCAISADGSLVVSAADDKTVKIWYDRGDQTNLEPPAYQMAAIACALSRDSRTAITAMSNKSVMVWDVVTGKPEYTLQGHTRKVNGCAISEDNRWGVTASQDQTLLVWDLACGENVLKLAGHSWSISDCSISADGHTILSASEDTTLKVWDATTGAELFSLVGHKRAVTGCAISVDGRMALSASGDATLGVWDVTTGKLRAQLTGHKSMVTSCALSADGGLAASASFDRTLRVWNTRTGQTLMMMPGHKGSISGCALSRDGGLLLSAARDRTIKLWHTSTGKCLTTLLVDEPLNDVDFAGDTDTVIAVSNSGIYFLDVERETDGISGGVAKSG
jgi:WD40 repeat protein